MNREEVMNSIALKKRFCKDCNLPIVVFDNPYFYERLQTIDVLFDCVDKFDVFCAELQRFANEQDYFEYYNKVKDSIIDFIKAKDEYNAFNNDNYQIESVVSKRNVYVEDNDGGAFVSIDMKKANFSAMKHYSPKIFDGADTWEQFMAKFTDSQHIIHSKYIRQVVLGACNPKKQIRYEHYLMNILCKHIMDTISNVSVFSLGKDEIIISVPREYGVGCGFSLSELKKAVNSCPLGIGQLVRVEMFELYKIEGTDGYMKTHNSDSNAVEFKCLNAEIFHQIVKHYFGQPVTENDLVFYHDGKLAKFLEEVNNPWN